MSWWQWRIDVGALMDTAASFFNLIDFAACLHAEVIRDFYGILGCKNQTA
ncbi:hypothetical protein [Selenomonas ruminantium]|nr:hypothetical protein [Selenomonas ruminantium]